MSILASYSVAMQGFVVGLAIGAGLVMLCDRRRSDSETRGR